VTSSWSFILQW